MKSFVLSTSILVLILFISGRVDGQVNVLSTVVTNPPATTCTNTIVTVSGENMMSNYAFVGTNFTVTGFSIDITVEYLSGIIGLPAIAPFTHDVDLGMLPVGNYVVTSTGLLDAIPSNPLTTQLDVGSCCGAIPSFNANAQTACVGDTIVFTNTSTGAISQSWYENNTLMATSTDYNSIVASSGSIEYKLVVTDGQCFDSIVQTIDVFDLPSIDLGPDTNNCLGLVTLDAGSGMASYNWSTLEISQTIDVNDGEYSVSVVDGNGCHNMDTVLVEPCVALTTVTNSKLTLSPNPSNGLMTIDFGTYIKDIKLVVVDITGKKIYSMVGNGEDIDINLENLNSGTYFLHIENEGLEEVIKFLLF